MIISIFFFTPVLSCFLLLPSSQVAQLHPSVRLVWYCLVQLILQYSKCIGYVIKTIKLLKMHLNIKYFFSKSLSYCNLILLVFSSIGSLSRAELAKLLMLLKTTRMRLQYDKEKSYTRYFNSLIVFMIYPIHLLLRY